MNLEKLSDRLLVTSAREWVTKERNARTEILHHLLEIERRKLFSDYKCSSIFDFAVRVLGYSEQEAYRRILAMRLMRDVPESAEKLASGSLSLTNAANAQALFQRLKKEGHKIDTADVLIKLEGKTSRAADAVLMELDPNAKEKRAEGIRALGHGEVEVRMVLKEGDLEMLERLRGLLVHKKGPLSNAEIFRHLLEGALIEPSPKPRKIPARVLTAQKGMRRHIPLAVQREVRRKTGGKCENCRSFFAPETDHIQMICQGGGNEPVNLRLFCRNCNQRAAKRAGVSSFAKPRTLRGPGAAASGY